jgi:hypothetical protein
MDILKFLSGNGLFMVLGLFIVGVVLFNKLKKRKYHNSSKKKKH